MNFPVRSMTGEAMVLALQSQVPLQGTQCDQTALYHIKQVAVNFFRGNPVHRSHRFACTLLKVKKVQQN